MKAILAIISILALTACESTGVDKNKDRPVQQQTIKGQDTLSTDAQNLESPVYSKGGEDTLQ